MTFKFATISLAAVLLAAPAVAAEPSVDPSAPGAAPAAAAAPAAPAPTAVASVVPAKKKIRCRTDYEIGSLVRKTRRCGDAETWRKADDAVRQQTREMQDNMKGLTQGF